MGLFFTSLYIFTAYVTPTVLFGELAEYRIELIVIILALLFSVPKLGSAELAKPRETWALLALGCAVLASFWAQGLFGLSITGGIEFWTQALIFPLILIHCRTRTHMQMIVVAMALACMFTIYRGTTDLFNGVLPSPYILPQGPVGSVVYRLQGMGLISDPNDFGQLLVLTMPLLFLFWRKGKFLLNLVRVLLPAGYLFFGLFETHSRGAMLALLVILIVSFRKKIGTVPSLVLAGIGFTAATALGWAGGGREVSVEQGEDRLDAWSTGLQLIKQHPLFGVGFKRFTDFYYITAHNTIVVCAAELGFVGFFCWIVFTQGSIRDLLVTSRKEPAKKKDRERAGEIPGLERDLEVPTRAEYAYSGLPVGALPFERRMEVGVHGSRTQWRPSEETDREGTWSQATEHAAVDGMGSSEEVKTLPPAEVRRMAAVLTAGFAGYLAAGWFISRAYVMALFIAGGLAQVVYRMALEQGIAAPRMAWGKLLKTSLFTAVGLIAVVYLGLVLQHLTKH